MKCNIILVYFVTRKLEGDTLEAWELHQGSAINPATFAEVDAFLNNHIRALEALGIKHGS